MEWSFFCVSRNLEVILKIFWNVYILKWLIIIIIIIIISSSSSRIKSPIRELNEGHLKIFSQL